MWKWIWPPVGTAPTSQNTDSEMFDRTDYPYSETFVREAIQNTLDARLDQDQPAIISFRFHNGSFEALRPFLSGAVGFRQKAGLHVPEEWNRSEIDWITIEDFNTGGLDGDLDDRFGNFWNYWLNFGISNKDGHGRGGRGIGRVTFLIASRLQTVFGLTRRVNDGVTAACGMTILRAMRTDDGIRSTHAYLAADEDNGNSIYHLHDSEDFHERMTTAFGFHGYANPPHRSGLALAIPYPHEELSAEGILASAIEHFAPAIRSRSLTVRVNDTVLDHDSLASVADEVRDRFRAEWIKQDVARYLSLVESGLTGEVPEIELANASHGLAGFRDNETIAQLQKDLDRDRVVGLRIRFPLVRQSRSHPVSLRLVAARTPEDKLPADRLFREGMSLPDVKAKSPGEIDLLVFVDDIELATYLNLCEGKAHLDLLESKEIRAKLEARGYRPLFTVRKFIKSLPTEIRTLLTPDVTEPETDVFDAFFAIPDTDAEKKRKGGRPEDTPPPPDPPPPPRPSPFVVRTLENGFRLEANPDYPDWPLNVSVTMAYADGSRNPAWTEFDFRPDDLASNAEDCELSFSKNKLTARDCGAGCNIEVTGFDNRRELDTRIRFWRHAASN